MNTRTLSVTIAGEPQPRRLGQRRADIVRRPAEVAMARHISVVPAEGLYIDGCLFPYAVGINFTVHTGVPHGKPGVTVFLPADVVSVNGRVKAGAPRRYRPGPFRELDIAAERARLADLGRRIAETRRRVLG